MAVEYRGEVRNRGMGIGNDRMGLGNEIENCEGDAEILYFRYVHGLFKG